MINTVKVSAGDFGGPVREWVFPPVDYVDEVKMADVRQVQILTNLILPKMR